MRGRPPKPTEVHKAEGTHRPDRHGATPTTVGGRGALKVPRGLPVAVRAAWRALAKPLQDAGILDQADGPLIVAAAVQLVRAREAGKDVEARGMLIEVHRTVGRGEDTMIETRLEANPAVKLEREALTEFRQLADRLGIGPVARARLSGLGTEGQSEEQAFDELAALRDARKAGAA